MGAGQCVFPLFNTALIFAVSFRHPLWLIAGQALLVLLWPEFYRSWRIDWQRIERGREGGSGGLAREGTNTNASVSGTAKHPIVGPGVPATRG